MISTPVIDSSTGVLFVAGAVESSQTGAAHMLWAIDAASGKILWSRQIDPPGSIPLNQLQRAALALANGFVYVGMGGNYGDCAQYWGYVVAVPESGSGSLHYYRVATEREGAIWAPSGVSVEPDGSILAATGNGASTSSYDQGDSVLKLSPTLGLSSYFAPLNWATYNAEDLDLGSAAPLYLPGGFVFQLGKPGVAFLISASNLGGLGGQLAELNACFSMGGDAYYGGTVYVPCTRGGYMAIGVGDSPPSLRELWFTPMPAGMSSPLLVGPILYALNWNQGELYAISAATGQVVFSLFVGPVEHFASISYANGMFFIPTADGVIAMQGVG